MAGDATPEEIAALQQALKDNAELLALYLDSLNLDMALSVTAEAATITENGIGRTITFPQPTARLSPHFWRWLAATAACVALVVFALLPRHREPAPAGPDIAVVIASTQSDIARLSIEPPTLFPAWASPTASMLDQPRIPQ